ncbi:MAG TPA: cysteine desulfurase family protein [Thermoanaerobaculia bacterium]|nr:cysteine desulfurase family protein [Thermoanaerobaculia bacterium]
MADPIYLDHHATTPCDPRVLERMLPFFTETFGNPAAVSHAHGRRAAAALEEARAAVADFFRVRPTEVFFTAGATESNNLALRGILRPGDHAITSAIEHKSVLEPLRALEAEGVSLSVLPVDRDGRVEPEAVRSAIRPRTRLCSIMAANGEIGTLEPIREIGELCRERGIPFHSDATQGVGKVPLDLSELPCDLLSASAHKLYGPKGIGALIVRRGIPLVPLLRGGGQEKGLRSGTVNVPGAVGFAAALEIRRKEMGQEAVQLTELRNRLWDRLLTEIPGASVNGLREVRLPGNLNVSFEGIDAESLMEALPRFSVSSGSACSAGEREASPVLLAIGLSEKSALGSLRLGLGRSTRGEELDRLADELRVTVARLREIPVA